MFLQYFTCVCILQPDRGAKRPKHKDGGAAGGGDDESRAGKHQKILGREMGRHRELVEAEESEELGNDSNRILEKLMDQDEDDPEVSQLYCRFSGSENSSVDLKHA